MIQRFAGRFRGHSAKQQVTLQLYAGTLDRKSGDHESGHRPLVVADSLPDQEIALSPSTVIERVCGVEMVVVVTARNAGVHMAVKNQAVTAARARQCSENAKPITVKTDSARVESLTLHPFKNVF